MRYLQSKSRYLALASVVLIVLAAGCGPTAYKITPIPVDRSLKESILIDDGGLAPAKIALVDVEGLLMNRRSFSLFGEGENPVSLFVEKLDKAAGDKAVKALIVRINSPGGAVTAADLMHSELLHFKERTGGDRPVVAVLMDVAASGGYYVASGADQIVAHPTTVTGSIGVVMQLISVADTMGKIGVKANTITSGKMKAAGSPLQHLSPEEREIFQAMVNRFYDRFVDVVAAGRSSLDEAQIREVADGRIWSADEAVQLGFVDRIGTLHDVVGDLKEQLGVKRVRVVTYHRPHGFKPNVYADAPANPPQVNLVNIAMPNDWPFPEPNFLYLWAPGL